MRLHPFSLPTAALVLAATVPSAAAQTAPAVVTDLPCQVEGATMLASGSGFTPDSAIQLQTDQVFEQGVADATGSFQIPFKAPIEDGIDADSGEQFTLKATDAAGLTSTTTFRTVQFRFQTSAGSKSPKSKRAWSFSGFEPGRAIYGHFRHKGRTRGTYRFGVAAQPCGTLKKSAPGIAVKGKVGAGQWTVYVDQFKTFKLGSSRQLKGTTTVFTVFRPRAASAADYLRG